MSYLSLLRLHFAGQFQTNVSTVNNDPSHFDNAGFKTSYQDMQASNMRPPNGWFNPQGDAAVRLLGCTINSAWTSNGQVPSSDPISGCIVADSNEAVPAKLVDLDPEQQLVSEIWGLTVRIADAAGNTLMSADYEPAAFMDIWDRATGTGGGDTNASASYQSILTNIQWGDVSASDFLTQLKAAASSKLLSIKFNMDGINMSYSSPDFMCGRITGTIGPQTATEPRHLIIGRHFMAEKSPQRQNFFLPAGGINFFGAVVDEESKCIFLDLGNALPTTFPGGPISDLGDLTLAYYDPLTTPTDPAGQTVPLGTIASSTYAGSDWYKNTAGVVTIPVEDSKIKMAGIRRLLLHNKQEDKMIAESPSASFVRADRYVYRLNPNDSVSIPVYAMQYGKLLPADTEINFTVDNGQLQPGPSKPPFWPFAGASPPVGTPVSAIPIPVKAKTSASGVAALEFTAGDPGPVRNFNNGQDYGIDGQVYGVRPSFNDPELADGPVNQWSFISFLVWSSWAPSNPITWTDVKPIFQQYANLYPVMSRFLNMANYESVKKHANLLSLAFALPVADPNSMPVTRDLSRAKRAAIVSWLANPIGSDDLSEALSF